jgi:hypothetical protein
MINHKKVGLLMSKIKLNSLDNIFNAQSDYCNDLCVGTIDDTKTLYLIDSKNMTASSLPNEYQKTPIYLYRSCGGYNDDLLMVSLLGEINLKHHHNFAGCAGIWGWLDKDFNEVIKPQYIYAENFFMGKTRVCKGIWDVEVIDGIEKYWCDDEKWGVINKNNEEIVPCEYDELYEVENAETLYFVHKGGWENGSNYIYDSTEKTEILQLDFNFDCGYMFNEIFVTEENLLFFIKHIPGKSKDLIYIYDLSNKEFLVHSAELFERTFNGEKSLVINKDGEDIVIY